MTVYFAQARTDANTVKIGFTSDLAARQKNMSVSTPGGVSILATIGGNKDTESYLHEKFAELRLGGEWFKFDDPIRDFIQDIHNGKQGLVPFNDDAIYMQRQTADYARDAVEIVREMAKTIINAEMRGIGDTVGAARYRLERKTGLSAQMLQRVMVRPIRDVSCGEYLHIKAVYDQLQFRRGPKSGYGEKRNEQF